MHTTSISGRALVSIEDFWFYRRDVQRLQQMKRDFLRDLDRAVAAVDRVERKSAALRKAQKAAPELR